MPASHGHSMTLCALVVLEDPMVLEHMCDELPQHVKRASCQMSDASVKKAVPLGRSAQTRVTALADNDRLGAPSESTAFPMCQPGTALHLAALSHLACLLLHNIR